MYNPKKKKERERVFKVSDLGGGNNATELGLEYEPKRISAESSGENGKLQSKYTSTCSACIVQWTRTAWQVSISIFVSDSCIKLVCFAYVRRLSYCSNHS